MNNQTTEQLLDAIRREAAQLDIKTQPEPQPLPAEESPSQMSFEQRLRLPSKPAYHYREFLQFDDEAFVRNAFLCILQREPDPAGLQSYLNKLNDGIEKQGILAELSGSEEAKRYGVRIRGLKGYRMIARLRRIRTLRPIAQRLLGLYRRICELPNTEEMNQYRANILQQLSWMSRQLQANERVTAASRDRSEQQALKQAEEVAQIRAENQALSQQLANLSHKIAYQQQTLAARTSEVESDSSTPLISPTSVDDSDVSAFYVAFEDACRGTREEVRDKMSKWLNYLPAIDAGSKQVLDIGCGRGEWLQLLGENGYDATGLDINPVMVNSCTEQGLTASLDDALAWLQRQPDASLAAITAFHVIEHVPFELLLRWTTEARRVLQPGGVLVMETPNPENILVGSHTFYHDPTHRNPITPTLLEFLAEYCGYADSELVRLHPYPEEAKVSGNDPLTERVNGHLCGPQDIALVARVPEAEAAE
ncbi:methyltransferase domain-containing protein [Marinobacterium stanieri]|uniref:methyltransferase domain-containing protein n=1 Tax=Marinobacterium stanieri TaxID=49186 RepID=UPI0002559E8E|nr:methyltransferase domain-containing protein [Marinobacterium stanieri]